jgi:hypothetical protein
MMFDNYATHDGPKNNIKNWLSAVLIYIINNKYGSFCLLLTTYGLILPDLRASSLK